MKNVMTPRDGEKEAVDQEGGVEGNLCNVPIRTVRVDVIFTGGRRWRTRDRAVF